MSATLPRVEPQALPASEVHPAVRWAFYIFILSLPFEYPKRSIPWEVTTLTCALFLLATVVQPGLCFRSFPRAVGWFGAFLYAFLMSFAVNGGEYADEAQKLFILQLQLVLLLWAAYNVLRDEAVFRRAPLVLAVACTARAALQLSGIATEHSVEWGGGERVSALGQNANQSAMIMTAGLIALIAFSNTPSRGRWLGRLLIWPVAAVIGIAIIQNGSRGGVIALGAGVLTLMLGGAWVWSRLRNAGIVLLSLGLLVWASYNSEGMRNRFTEVTSRGYMAGRERLYPELMRMFLERPIVGYGPIANKYVLGGRVPEQHYERRDAHNVFLEVMTATGIVGLLPFMVGLWLAGRAAWRGRHGPAGMMPTALLVAALASNMSGNQLAAPLTWLVLSFALASDRSQEPMPAPAPAPGRPRRRLIPDLRDPRLTGSAALPSRRGGGA